jgi:hypothetical protein
MKPAGRQAILVTCLSLSACQMTSAQIAKPALLTNSGAEVKLEISQAIIAMTGFFSVTLADQDLTQSSELVIERKHQRTASGDLIQGRDLELPQRFQLVSQAGQCWLVKQATGQRTLLKKVQCRVDDKAG